jgi:polyferredoxin
LSRKTKRIKLSNIITEEQEERTRSSFKLYFKKFQMLLYILIIFHTIAITLWLVLDEIFYLINFSIIGTSVGLGFGLWPVFKRSRKHIARRISQLLVGGYMFFGLGFGLIYLIWGIIEPENMQLEGFWFWLLAGQFAASVIHYSVAKIFGPTLFVRGWCGWACWTAAVLDVLPWKKSPGRKDKWGHLRYVLFTISTILVLVLVFSFNYTLSSIKGMIDFTGTFSGPEVKSSLFQIHEFWWFLIGNLIYFMIAIALAIILKDNRAFCKYVCPIVPFMKVGSRASIMKIAIDTEKCIQCGSCEKVCPMDIELLTYSDNDSRVTSTECILCMECINACPKSAIRLTFRFDIGFKEHLRIKKTT